MSLKTPSAKHRRPRRSVPARAMIAPLVIHSDGTVSRQYSDEDRLFFQRYQPTTIVSEKDVEESRRIGKAIDALLTQCWFNARRAIQRLGDYAGASYVEGWAVDIGGMMLEHGWLVKDDKIVDPTLPDGIAAYFPGLEFKGREGIDEFLGRPLEKACGKSPFFFAFGWGGCESPSFQAARENAMVFVRRLCMAVCFHAMS